MKDEKITGFLTNLKEKGFYDYLLLLVGSIFYTFIAWRWNMALATWIAPIFLMRFFRNQKKLWSTLIALPLLAVATYLKMRNGWDLSVIFQISVSILGPVLFMMIPLYLDRMVSKRYQSFLATLVFPSSTVLIEYLIGLTPLGSSFALGVTQFAFGSLIQISSITGIWGVSFLIAWMVPIINNLWEDNFNLNFKKLPNSTKISTLILISSIAFGAFRVAVIDPSSPTVKIGSISVEHTRDYWSDIIDNNTPASDVYLYTSEFDIIENKSFALSEKAVLGGAKIIFWSEGNLPYYEDYEETFLNKSKEFAIEHQVYFAPGVVKFYYDSYISDNKIMMFAPNGTLLFEYIKTKSWYETTSDGIVDYVDTPFGRLASTICFDNDFPNYVRQVGKANVDILLVPSFDTKPIKDFHSEVALFRGLENGVSVVRHSNAGASYAIDYLGNIVAYQDYYDTADRLMFSDIPTKGVFTLYSVLGDWVVYTNFVVFGLILTDFIFRQVKKKPLINLKKNINSNSDESL